MHPHHETTIQNAVAHFQPLSDVLALVLVGSIAHGFATAASDVDVLILIADQAYKVRQQSGRTTFFSRDLASYEGGYVDGKYVSLSFIRDVGQRGSEPARFAFQGARVLFARGVPGLEAELAVAAAYPVHEKARRIQSFGAQLEAWYWYCGEAGRKQDAYLLHVAAGKLVLFGGRLVLAHNEMLYPFHKWFVRALETAPEKPEGLRGALDRVLAEASEEAVRDFYELVKGFQKWEGSADGWPAQFMLDTELNWVDGSTPVDEL